MKDVSFMPVVHKEYLNKLSDKALNFNLLRPNGKAHVIGRSATNDMHIAVRHMETGGNLGICPGWRLVIVDIDRHQPEKDGYVTLEMLGIELPETLTVSTPSGGEHRYYWAPWPNARGLPMVGVDILTGKQNVVIAGSVVDGRHYRITSDAPIVPCPESLLCRRKASDKPYVFSGYGDFPANAKPPAEPVKKGGGGDGDRPELAELSKVVFEIPNDGALNYRYFFEIGAAIHWSTDGSDEGYQLWRQWAMQHPQFDESVPDGSTGRASNGGMPGLWSRMDSERDSPLTFATLVMQAQRVNREVTFDPVAPEDLFDGDKVWQYGKKHQEAVLPIRPRVLGSHALRRVVTVVGGPGGSGKSLWALTAGVSLAAGVDVLELGFKRHQNVLVLNNEDDNNEIARRLNAITKHYGLDADAMPGKLHVKSGYGRTVQLAVSRDKQIKDNADSLIRYLKANDIALMIADPLVSLHNANENSNADMEQVMAVLRRIAHEADCAVMLIHHTRKGDSEDADDSMRGASAIVNAARVVRMFRKMSKKDAEGTIIPENRRKRFFCMTYGKENLTMSPAKGQWYRLETIQLPGIDEEDGSPAWESVGVPVPVDITPYLKDEKKAEGEKKDSLLLAMADALAGHDELQQSDLVRAMTKILPASERKLERWLADLPEKDNPWQVVDSSGRLVMITKTVPEESRKGIKFRREAIAGDGDL